MIYLKCPKCQDMVLVPILTEDEAELEAFVFDHLPCLDEDEVLSVIDSAGDA